MRLYRWRHGLLGALIPSILMATAAGCAAPLSEAAKAHSAELVPHVDVAALRARIAAAQSSVTQLRADVRMVSFGPEGRLRGRAEVYLARPDRLRYTLFGPQAGPLIVLACDGQMLRGLDLRARRFVSGSADAEQFDAWLSPLHLRLDASGWVGLLLGELDVPPQASAAVGAPKGLVALRWSQGAGHTLWAAFDPHDGHLHQARLCDAMGLHTSVTIERRGSRGVPERLRIEHQKLGADGISQIELSLADVEFDAPQTSQIYSLLPPEGFAIVAPLDAP